MSQTDYTLRSSSVQSATPWLHTSFKKGPEEIRPPGCVLSTHLQLQLVHRPEAAMPLDGMLTVEGCRIASHHLQTRVAEEGLDLEQVGAVLEGASGKRVAVGICGAPELYPSTLAQSLDRTVDAGVGEWASRLRDRPAGEGRFPGAGGSMTARGRE